MVYRQQQEDTAKSAMQQQMKEKAAAVVAEENGTDAMDIDQDEEGKEEMLGSKVIVIHLGSQNLRIGLASDALPKTIPSVIARRSEKAEFEEEEEPYPKRLKLESGSSEEDEEDESIFGPEVCFFRTPGMRATKVT